MRPDEPSRGKEAADSIVRIVGVGASAGGLEAVSRLLEALPADLGVAVVVVEHLHPKHESMLPQLLASSTSMPVEQVRHGIAVEADHVYVIPPGSIMKIAEGKLHLAPSGQDTVRRTPIDLFLSSLAAYADGKAIAVILSGSGSDGAAGLKAIKAAGGIVLVQDPESARFEGMPRAAIATSVVDFIGSPEELAEELARIARHPYLAPALGGEDLSVRDDDLPAILPLLRRETEVDFSVYKTATLRRRIQRRMAVHKIQKIADYTRLLRENAGEVRALFQDILIHVTSFFRDADAFELLKAEIFPKLCAQRESSIRVWIPACSTGEEAYSVAMSLLEFLGSEAGSVPIQIFATDVCEDSIDHARKGVFPEGIAADISAERLRKFFAKIDNGFRVKQSVRELCVFARQDVTRDPPFSKVDLIVCRNLLIYLTAQAQKRLFNVFHYALKPHGFLMLGEAETVGGQGDLFTAVDRKRKLYARRQVNTPMHLDAALATPHVTARRAAKLPTEGDLSRETNRIILDRFAPPSVVVDDEMQIVEIRGRVVDYLELPVGRATLDVVKLAREGLAHALRTALRDAKKSGSRVRRDGVRVRHDTAQHRIAVEVIPFGDGAGADHYLIAFDERKERSTEQLEHVTAHKESGESVRVTDLEAELESTRANMQTVIQDLEAANEELQSANEEVLSSNEELQSTNEELDTAREELQSTNEELNTVNDELQHRNEELLRLNSDLVNLLASVQIAIVIVASDLSIRRFTPMAERVLNLLPADVGRSIGHIKPNIQCDDLEALIRHVIDDVTPVEREVQDREGRWLSLRVRPYKNVENQIDGAVLALFDINAAKEIEAAVALSRDYAEAIVGSVHDPLLVVDEGLRVTSINRPFARLFGMSEAYARGKHVNDLGHGRFNATGLHHMLQESLAGDDWQERDIVAEVPRIGQVHMRVKLARLDNAAARRALIVTLVPEQRRNEG
jgi:two-component system CheB/CheR fusion protein